MDEPRKEGIDRREFLHLGVGLAATPVLSAGGGLLAATGKPRWKVLGTEGAIVDAGGEFRLHTFKDDIPVEGTIPYEDGDHHRYYENIADHLLRDGDLMVKPEEARRVIAVMQCAEKSSKTGKTVRVPYEDENGSDGSRSRQE